MQKVYLETTIPSYLTSRPSRDIVIAGRQEVTREWWETRRDEFMLFVSPYVLDESAKGDPEIAKKRMQLLESIPVLAENEEVLTLAQVLIDGEIIPEKAAIDALHISIATYHKMNLLLTWNCAHIANATNIRRIERSMSARGFESPIICTPDELMEGE